MSDSLWNILARNLLFRGLPDRIIDRLAAVALRRTYGKNERIFSQGDPGDALYGVISGRVRIGAVGAAGQEVFLNIMEPDDSFGEIAVIDGLPRTAGALAMESTELTAIRRADLFEVLRAESELAIHLLSLFCERIRWASDLVEESVFLAPPERLAKRLLSLAQLHGRKTDRGIEFRISQSELAKFLGMSRQNVNEKLQVWKASGWVSLSRGRLLIVDVQALKDLAAGAADADDDVRPPPDGTR
jgi:CRP/FNR family cyclic AMP-dependent transcriptional regulator